jgi:hypothetical protein
VDILRFLMNIVPIRAVLEPVMRPGSRILLGLIAVPLFRFMLRRIFRIQEISRELEKDLQEWFRGSLLLFAASANMEHLLFGWLTTRIDWLDRPNWLTLGLRLLMVIGVIQTMPDQELFAVLHPGPPKLRKDIPFSTQLRNLKWQILKGHLARHVNKSSPVLALMCAIVGGELTAMPQPYPNLLPDFQRLMFGCDFVPCTAVQTALAIPLLSLQALPPAPDNPDANQTPLAFSRSDCPGLINPHVSAALSHMNQTYAGQRSRTQFFVGWLCYFMAITQYLIIGLVTSRDRAAEVLSLYDQAVAERRQQLIQQYQLEQKQPDVPANDARV